ncbi:response regulator transcription factor [Paenibacillus puerhi]|uniref:response regulator transcription factor n=1 Tax=Paenibacillus puerhi TaxID=2692622 RepID=UPI0013594995|nr:response regulator [Paenibacillus puerhi]
MLNIMLVDDDFPVLEFLRQAVPWASLDMKVQGVYQNGMRAMEAAKASPPDILITDIGMPHMNGLELIEKMREFCPQLKVAILSCHNDFSYAQQAIKLQVDDYLLKETMEAEHIVKMLRSLSEQLKEVRTEKHKVEQLQKLTKWSGSAIMTRLLRTLLYHPLIFTEQLTEQAAELGIHLDTYAYLPVVGFIDRFKETQKRFVSEDNLMFAVENLATELTGGPSASVIFRPSPDRLLLLFPIVPGKLHPSGIAEVEETLRNIQKSLLRYLRVGTTFLIGEQGQDVRSLRGRIIELMEGAEDARFYTGHGVLTKFRPLPYSAADLFAHYASAQEQLKQVVLDQAGERVEPVTRYWTEMITADRYPPGIVKEWFLQMMLDLQLKFKSLQNFETDYSMEVLHQTILEAETVGQLREMVSTLLHRSFPVMEHIYKQPQRRDIAEAQRYVLRALNRRVTQEEVAEFLHLNPSYFSRLFKRETGENFVEFATRTKMEKAKELIDRTDCTVEELAEQLGYDNKSYFLKCFKSYTGMTPSEYAGKVQRAKPRST